MASSQGLLRTSLLSTIVVVAIMMLFASLRFGTTLFGQNWVNLQPGSVNLEPGTDRMGLDYKNFEIDGGPELCQHACASDANCQAYTWVRPGVQKPKAVCWLKNGVPPPTSNANCVSGVKWSLPQALTGGVAYSTMDFVDSGSVDGILTVQGQYFPSDGQVIVVGQNRSEVGWANVSDGDRGKHAGEGFYHQELTLGGGGIRVPNSGSIHTSSGNGLWLPSHPKQPGQPHHRFGHLHGHDTGRNVCPNGRVARRHFDMSSGNGSRDCRPDEALGHPEACGFFVWCEYTDPHKLCTGSDCVNRVIRMATVGIQSNTDATVTLCPSCPPFTSRSPFYDDGRSAGQGLSFCRN